MSATNAPYGVLNPDLRVKNTVGLRVVDASALVRVPSVHPQGFIYIFAERAAAIIAYEGGYLNALKAPAAPPAP
jgi:choline dehydrogenase-like flavoprotein